MEKRKRQKQDRTEKAITAAIIFLSLLLFALLIYLFITGIQPVSKDPIILDGKSVSWEGDQQLPQYHGESKQIAIPGFKSLYFRANQTTQKVNFQNPEINNGILFRESLVVNDETLWRSGNIPAGQGYYQIDLEKTLPVGNYAAYLKIDCYTEEGDKLNGAQIEFNLTVQ